MKISRIFAAVATLAMIAGICSCRDNKKVDPFKIKCEKASYLIGVQSFLNEVSPMLGDRVDIELLEKGIKDMSVNEFDPYNPTAEGFDIDPMAIREVMYAIQYSAQEDLAQGQIDSAAYLIGLNYGFGIKNDEYLDIKSFCEGVEDAYKYGPAITGEEECDCEDCKDCENCEDCEAFEQAPRYDSRYKYDPAKAQEFLMEFSNEIQERMEQEQREKNEKNLKEGEKFLAKNKKNKDVKVTESGLQYIILDPGNDNRPAPTDRVLARYTGMLIDGTVFDSTDRGEAGNEPIKFGLYQVISGWTEGLQLIGEGGKIKLFIPAELGYGTRDMGTIPPNSVLIFDIDLVEVEKAE